MGLPASGLALSLLLQPTWPLGYVIPLLAVPPWVRIMDENQTPYGSQPGPAVVCALNPTCLISFCVFLPHLIPLAFLLFLEQTRCFALLQSFSLPGSLLRAEPFPASLCCSDPVRREAPNSLPKAPSLFPRPDFPYPALPTLWSSVLIPF